MKRLEKLYFLLLFLIFSCNVLDQEPQDKINTDQAFSSEANAQKALNGLYNLVQSVYDWRVQVISDLSSDITQSIDTWDAFINMDEYKTTQDNSEVEDLYIVLYKAIDLANNIIVEVPKLKLSVEKENDLVGQAQCIRGLMYFELARFWGGIPGSYGTKGVVLQTLPSSGISEGSFAPRSTLDEVYDLIKSDWERAEIMLPASRGSDFLDRSRVNQVTAKALLARLHLYLRDYLKAEQYATEVIGDARFELVKPYSLIFKTKNTMESIFELQFAADDVSGLRQWYFPSSEGGRGGLALHQEFYEELIAATDDERSQLVIYDENRGVAYPTKYSTPGNSDNTHVIRLAEMYLIRSEVRVYNNDLPGAQEDLNKIRSRASVSNTSASSREELLSAILKERKFEFYQEGHRWFDLIRTGNALTVLNNLSRKNGSQPVSLVDPNRQVFPFPGSEILVNKNLEQNEAYR